MPSQNVEFNSKKRSSDHPGVDEVDPKEVWEKRSQVTIIDVRRPEEFSGPLGHIPGALHMVLDTLPDRLDDIPKDKTLVFVCLSGGRSGRACTFVQEEGYTQVLNMKGGMTLWNNLQLEVEGRSKA